MKTRTHLIALAVGLLAVVGGPAAEAGSGALSAVVPFSFTAGGKSLGPGTYTIDRQSSGVILVRGSRTGAFVSPTSTVSASSEGPTRLVFHRYGNQYFLRQVWFQGTRGHALPETRAEREFASRNGKVASPPVVVIVTAPSGRTA